MKKFLLSDLLFGVLLTLFVVGSCLVQSSHLETATAEKTVVVDGRSKKAEKFHEDTVGIEPVEPS